MKHQGLERIRKATSLKQKVQLELHATLVATIAGLMERGLLQVTKGKKKRKIKDMAEVLVFASEIGADDMLGVIHQHRADRKARAMADAIAPDNDLSITLSTPAVIH
jgi:predicted regulator of Ras-like GTPase activity (Roadblock/LC7/MglB family)